MAKTPTALDLEPIDRLEDKVRLLVALVERLREERTRTAEDNQRLHAELETARERVAQTERADDEVTTLRAERDQIRTRVTGMLEQLDALDL